jgi:hypothetical protein
MLPLTFLHLLSFVQGLMLVVGVDDMRFDGCALFWSSMPSFWVNASSLAESGALIAEQTPRRSFLHCVSTCMAASGVCAGVVFKDGVCGVIRGDLVASHFVTSPGGSDDFRVLVFPQCYREVMS